MCNFKTRLEALCYPKSQFERTLSEVCTAPQMIPNRKWSQDRKWSPNWNANDPEPQMIPDVDRKWSRRKVRNGMEFRFSVFYFYILIFIYFHPLYVELDKRKGKIFWQRKL